MVTKIGKVFPENILTPSPKVEDKFVDFFLYIWLVVIFLEFDMVVEFASAGFLQAIGN